MLPVILGGGVVVIMMAVLVTCAVAIGSSAKSGANLLSTSAPLAPTAAGGAFGSQEHPEDVELSNCARSAGLGWASVDVKVTNHSSKPSTYYIKISYASPDGTVNYGEGWVSIDTLAPGQVTTRSAFPGQDVPANAQLACVLASAKRTAA